jgi:hypothetical protein
MRPLMRAPDAYWLAVLDRAYVAKGDPSHPVTLTSE